MSTAIVLAAALKPANAAAVTASAVSSGLAISLDTVSVAFFGVPVSMWVACFAGALFGATWYPPDARVSRWWAVITNTLAGVFLTAIVVHYTGWPKPLSAGAGFFISSAPLLVFQWLRGRISGAPPAAPPPTANGEAQQP